MKISVQIYSLRESGDLDHQLKLARDAGFEWVETVAIHGLSPQAFADKIASHWLKVSSMHVGLLLLEAEMPKLVEACRLTGCPLVIVPWLPPEARATTAEGWRATGLRLANLGDQLKAQRLQLAYHNHDWEFAVYDGKTALEWIFSSATPLQLRWEADLGWVSRAGADPWVWLERLAPYLITVHAKDIAAPGHGLNEDGWATLGQGVMPWADLLAHLKHKVDLVVFEHDKPVDYATMLQQSHAFMAKHLA